MATRTKLGHVLASFAALAGASSCDSIDRAASRGFVTEWDCPAVACESIDRSSACTGSVCAREASDTDVRVAVRLPATSLAPGAFAIARPSSVPACIGCVSLPPSYATEHGILVARDVASQLGWGTVSDAVVPATVAVEPLVEGRTPLSEILPRPIAPMVLERWPRAGTAWRSPSGGDPVTSRAVLFEGSYRRTLQPAAPYDSQLPPFTDTITVPQGEHLLAIGRGRLATVSLARVELPAHAAGWTMYLADATGERRSSWIRTDAYQGPAAFRIDTTVSPDPLLLDLVVVPGDESLVWPRLVVPAPTALRRVAYPPRGRSSRVTVRVLRTDGTPVGGARVAFRVRDIEQPTAEDGVFAAYALGAEDVVTGADGTAIITAPYGNATAFARAMDGDTLKASAELPFFFTRETVSLTFRVEATRVLDGRCSFVGGRALVGATLEARAIDARRAPASLARVSVRTDGDGAFRLALPVGAFEFWLHAPPGAPMHDSLLGSDAIGGAALATLPCRLTAPSRRLMRLFDREYPKGSPLASAIVETLRVIADRPTWLGEAISAPDGRAMTYEAP